MSTFDKIELNRMNYGVLLNDLPLIKDIEIDLGDWTLRRATIEEINEFRPELIKYSISNYFNYTPSQEVNISKSEQGFLHTPITDPNDWRYMVVLPKNERSIPGDKFAEALRISDWDLWVELWSIKTRVNGILVNKLGGSPFHCLRILTENSKVTVIQKTNYDRLKEIIITRKNFNDEKYPTISKALRMFREHDINRENSLKHLGYFTIIESILSHAPAANDSLDSISRQLKRNLILLDNRMHNDYNLMLDKFNGVNPEKLISKLYSYRSCIAHGNNSEEEIDWFFANGKYFESNFDFMNKKNLLSWYLRKIVQRVLFQAIIEPQLVTDLKG